MFILSFILILIYIYYQVNIHVFVCSMFTQHDINFPQKQTIINKNIFSTAYNLKKKNIFEPDRGKHHVCV